MGIQKFALVTGCSEGGIGHALAQEFQERGVHVFATARTISKMNPLEGLPNVTLLTLDVTSEASINNAVAIVSKHTDGTLDYLINNAGCAYTMPVLDLDIQLAREMFDVNVWGVFSMIQAFAPLVIAAKGTIANMASVGALLNPPYMGQSLFPSDFHHLMSPLTKSVYSDLRKLQDGMRGPQRRSPSRARPLWRQGCHNRARGCCHDCA